MKRRCTVLLLLLVPMIGGCILGEDTGPSEPTWQRDGLFTNTVASVTLEVDYAAGAEPYTEAATPRGNNPWRLTKKNLGRLFQENGADLTIPDEAGEMEEVSVDNGGPYTSEEILAIADAHRDTPSTETDRSFYVLFLDGKFEDEEGRRDGVLGVSIGDTGVLALFKPVIESTANPPTGGFTRRFVEQTTLIHEFGHAAGLVNNGLPMDYDHHDEAHGAHCDNDDCAMYWANEGASDMAKFVREYVTSGDSVVFREACLADVDAAGE